MYLNEQLQEKQLLLDEALHESTKSLCFTKEIQGIIQLLEQKASVSDTLHELMTLTKEIQVDEYGLTEMQIIDCKISAVHNMVKNMDRSELIEFIGEPVKYKNAELLIKKFNKLKEKLQWLKSKHQIYEDVPEMATMDFNIKAMFGKHMRKFSVPKKKGDDRVLGKSKEKNSRMMSPEQ